MDLFTDIEMPLSKVLGNMEYEGIRCEISVLNEMGSEIFSRIEEVRKTIYDLSGEERNHLC